GEAVAADDKALSYADWQLQGGDQRRGTTAADGTLALGGLVPGDYRLELRKTINGDLIETSVDLNVGNGGGQFVIELEQGRVRTTTWYEDDGVEVREILAPDGSRLQTRDGTTVLLADSYRRLSDPEGDGTFLPDQCASNVWRCENGQECGAGRICQCTASCPLCEDCGPPVCAPPAPYPPYRCNQDGSCSMAGDRCVCVSSCPDCDDCAGSVCVPGLCQPVEIASLSIVGLNQLRVGRSTGLRATAELDDGSSLDVTYLVRWQATDAAIAGVDAWGTVTAHALGAVRITATLGEVATASFDLSVVERPPLQRLEAQIASCFYPWGRPIAAEYDPSLPADALPHPMCNDTVRIGQPVTLLAWAFYADGEIEDVTATALWSVAPAGLGSVSDGTFTASAEGSATITATFAGASDTLQLRVVAEATIVQLSIYPNSVAVPPIFFPVFADDPRPGDVAAPCFECGYDLTVLIGDLTPFVATARYDTGEWQEVTTTVSWRTSSAEIAAIDAAGTMSAVAPGSATIEATYEGSTSNPVHARIVAEATLLDLYIYQEGDDRVVEKGSDAYFAAQGNYDIGFGRSVTAAATWHSSDETIGGFDAPGVFTGRAAGEIEVWAEIEGKTSPRLPMRVFERSDLDYCDPDAPNRGMWSDAFNRVTLESDCASYSAPEVVELRFTVTERERPFGIFDPCLDLYVYRDGQKVRTIREQGCGEPFLAPGAPGFEDAVVRFQHKAFWDLRDDQGQLVAPGEYTVFGRFYLYYDPVVSIAVRVN
ncbi:MAG TPA: Ig-like domain-containing protein, partial [Terriglobales bacterium]|nr:Ig-like domain-containing protein [Terriglobales bacterium]